MKKVSIIIALFTVLVLVPTAASLTNPGVSTQRDPGDQVKP